MKKQGTLIILLSFFVLSCQNTKNNKSVDEKTESAKADTNSVSSSGIKKEASKAYRNIDTAKVAELNELIKLKKLKSPLEIITTYSPESQVMEGDYNYDLELMVENDGIEEYVLTETGILDDSIEGRQVSMSFKKEGDSYRVLSIKESYKCRKNRGSSIWSATICN